MTDFGRSGSQLFSQNRVKALHNIYFMKVWGFARCASSIPVKQSFLGISAPCRLNRHTLLSADFPSLAFTKLMT